MAITAKPNPVLAWMAVAPNTTRNVNIHSTTPQSRKLPALLSPDIQQQSQYLVGYSFRLRL